MLTSSVEGHAAGAGEIVLLEAAPLDELLGGYVAGGEENGRCHGLREQRAGGQPAIVPSGRSGPVSRKSPGGSKLR